jgi:hypothetical protein
MSVSELRKMFPASFILTSGDASQSLGPTMRLTSELMMDKL